MNKERIVSGIRPTGPLHLGHYLGVLKKWVSLQDKYECFYFIADWHALTSEYKDPSIIEESTKEIIITWLSVGIDHLIIFMGIRFLKSPKRFLQRAKR